MKLYTPKLTQVTFGEMVDEMFKRIAAEKNIKITPYSSAVRYEKDDWTYETNPVIVIELSRWINSYRSDDLTIKHTYVEDFDEAKLEHDIRKAIDSLSEKDFD
jgi:hypothetical protein